MTFHHTMRTLGAMRLARHAVLLLMLVGLLGAWAAWLALGTMTIYVRSESGRLEVQQSAVAVNAPVDGAIVECGLSLGRHIQRGTSLVRLDARTYELQAAEKRAEIDSRSAAVASIGRQIAVEEEAREVVARFVSETARTGQARIAVNQRSFERKREEDDVMRHLHEQSLASKLDALRTAADTENLKMQAKLATQQAELDTSDATTTLRDRDVKIAALRKALVDAEHDLVLERARLATLDFEVERREIRATADGTLADVITCTPGMTVTSATKLGAILPFGDVRIVASFKPSESLGRVKPGQHAIVRVENFPWTQYGTLSARVSEVGAEPRDGHVRVELDLATQGGAIPPTHGMIAVTEVETEQLSPARLLLRLAGQGWTSAPSPASAPVGATPLEAAR